MYIIHSSCHPTKFFVNITMQILTTSYFLAWTLNLSITVNLLFIVLLSTIIHGIFTFHRLIAFSHNSLLAVYSLFSNFLPSCALNCSYLDYILLFLPSIQFDCTHISNWSKIMIKSRLQRSNKLINF